MTKQERLLIEDLKNLFELVEIIERRLEGIDEEELSAEDLRLKDWCDDEFDNLVHELTEEH